MLRFRRYHRIQRIRPALRHRVLADNLLIIACRSTAPIAGGIAEIAFRRIRRRSEVGDVTVGSFRLSPFIGRGGPEAWIFRVGHGVSSSSWR
jgi:hypothetical protein